MAYQTTNFLRLPDYCHIERLIVFTSVSASIILWIREKKEPVIPSMPPSVVNSWRGWEKYSVYNYRKHPCNFFSPAIPISSMISPEFQIIWLRSVCVNIVKISRIFFNKNVLLTDTWNSDNFWMANRTGYFFPHKSEYSRPDISNWRIITPPRWWPLIRAFFIWSHPDYF